MLDGELLARLRGLIREHRMEPIEDYLLAHSAPCITLTIADPYDPRGADPPIGASRMGGAPDLPHDFSWPTFESSIDGKLVHSGFLLQIDLSKLPLAPGNPLPATGLLSVFHRDQCAPDFSESFEIHLFSAHETLRRTRPPDALMCASEVETCLSGESVLIDGVLGRDKRG